MLSNKIATQILDGTLSNQAAGLCGVYRGYYISIYATQMIYSVQINATATTENGMEELSRFLQNQQMNNKYLKDYAVRNNNLSIDIAVPNLIKNLPARLNEIIVPIINYLAGNAFISGCGDCGANDIAPECYEINGVYHYLCPACAGNIGSSLQLNQQNVLSQKSNMAAGLVGAFLGSLIGCVVWVLLYRLGYIAGLAGAVTGICAMKGYEMFGKHLDKKGVISCIVMMLVMIFFANKIAWSWEIFDVYSPYYDVTFFDCFLSADEVIAESDLTVAYYGELVIGYLLTVVASYKDIIAAFKTSTGSFSMKKVK